MAPADVKLLQRMLDSPSVDSWISPLRHRVLNRRKFLIGSSSALASTAATPLFAPPGPAVTGTGIVTVTFNGNTWTIDPGLFARDGASKPKVSWRRDPTVSPGAPRYYIQLANARLPGTAIRGDFQAEIYERDEVWRIRLKFRVLSKSQELALADWIMQTPSGEIAGPVGPQTIEFGWSGCFVTIPTQGGELRIAADF